MVLLLLVVVVGFFFKAHDFTHLEAHFALFTAEAGQHEEDEGEETREGDGHHSQGGRPGKIAQRSAICRTQRTKHNVSR